jgi:hypothetical protein
MGDCQDTRIKTPHQFIRGQKKASGNTLKTPQQVN